MVSIRFGGFQFATGNELNGLTTGALGRNTVIEFVEVYNNADDDFEPFGGRNHYRYIGGFCGGDDGFDGRWLDEACGLPIGNQHLAKCARMP